MRPAVGLLPRHQRSRSFLSCVDFQAARVGPGPCHSLLPFAAQNRSGRRRQKFRCFHGDRYFGGGNHILQCRNSPPGILWRYNDAVYFRLTRSTAMGSPVNLESASNSRAVMSGSGHVVAASSRICGFRHSAQQLELPVRAEIQFPSKRGSTH